MREQMEKWLAEAEERHEKNRRAYRAAMLKKNTAEAELREACRLASVTANELAGIKAAVKKLPPPAPPPEAEAA